MVQEAGYQRTVAPRTAAPMPLARPETFGAGVGQAAAQAGDALHRSEIREYQLDRQETRDQELADYQHRFALARENMDDVTRTLRENADAGAAKHTERVKENWQAQRETLLNGITEDGVRRHAAAQLDEYQTRLVDSEANFESGQRINKLVTDQKETITIAANRARRLVQPEDYAQELKYGIGSIEAMEGVPRDVKDQLVDTLEQSVAIGFLQGRVDDDPLVAKAMLASGAFDAVLEPGQVEQLLSGADVEIRRQDAELARKAAEERAALKEQISTILEYDKQGVEVPPEMLAAAQADAAAIGDTSLSIRIEGIRSNNAFAKVYEQTTPIQREQRMTALAGKGKRSDAEDREYKWLQDHSGALDAEFERDPVRSLAKYGGAPEVDTNDAASLQARAQWSRTQTRATGRFVPPLSRNEVAPLQDLYAKGNGGQKQVFGALDNFAIDQRVEVARMIAPNDAIFQELSTLNPGHRNMAMDGADALRANRAILKSEDPRVNEAIAGAIEDYRRASVNMEGDRKNAVQQIARQIMAATLDRTGGEPTEALARLAINRALGATGKGGETRGGMNRWEGTDQYYLRPEGMTGRDFTAAIVRFNKANPKLAPVNPDGSPANLNRVTPVALGGGLYEFRSGRGEVVRRKDGLAYRARVSE